MRRSKSDPAKYARAYKKISQRRMTGPGNDDNFDESPSASALNGPGAEEKEMERLREIMRTSRAHLDRAAAARNGTSLEEQEQDQELEQDESANSDGTPSTQKTKRKRSKKDNDRDEDGVDKASTDAKEESIFSQKCRQKWTPLARVATTASSFPPRRRRKARQPRSWN